MTAKIDGLKNQDVIFNVCDNTVRGRKVDVDHDLYNVEKEDIVPSGVAEVARLQALHKIIIVVSLQLSADSYVTYIYKKMKHLLILLFAIFASSCSSNGTSPKPSYSLNYQFQSDKNYQYVYRLILNNADSCSKQGVISKSIAEGQHYSDIKAGDITISVHAPFGKYQHIRVKVDTIDNKTNISVSNDYEAWDGLAKAIKVWVENETTFCR